MAPNYSTLLYAPLHTTLGVTATLDVPGHSGSPYSISVIDKTKGIEVASAGGVGMFTVRPAVLLRAVDVADLGLIPEDLTGASMTVNALDWTVKAVEVSPTPGGQADGRVILFLEEAA